MDFLETFKLRLGDGWVLCQPDRDRLVVLNATGKLVWDLLSEGYGQQEIASAFAQHFGLSVERALADVRKVIGGLEEAGFPARPSGEVGTAHCSPGAPTTLRDAPATPLGLTVDCGTFRFGHRWVRMHSAVSGIDTDYFSRFRHRAAGDAVGADVLELSGGLSRYRLTFGGEIIAELSSLAELIGRTHKLFLSWEHPDTNFLAYFHAAAVSRGEHSILLPGVSGVGKSTLTAYLVGHGFAYLGDDLIAMATADWSLRPLPTLLSLKSGSWPILETLYPQLPHLPTVHCHGRTVRYVEPMETSDAGGAPSVILFPTYAKSGDTRLSPLAPLRTLMRLLETDTDLDRPATAAKLAEFLRFVEQTPAYELIYANLPSAKAVIEDWLDHAS